MTRFSWHCWECSSTRYYDTKTAAKEGMTNHANRLRHSNFTLQKNGKDIEAHDFVEE